MGQVLNMHVGTSAAKLRADFIPVVHQVTQVRQQSLPHPQLNGQAKIASMHFVSVAMVQLTQWSVLSMGSPMLRRVVLRLRHLRAIDFPCAFCEIQKRNWSCFALS